MSFLEIAAVLVTCFITDSQTSDCFNNKVDAAIVPSPQVAGESVAFQPIHTGLSHDVVITAEAALVWDEATGAILYQKNSDAKRPIASLSKLLSALVVRDQLGLNDIVTIPLQARQAQLQGANIKLPIGEHATVYDLLNASLVASANDAMVTLAVATAGSEDNFVLTANEFARKNGILNTVIANSTGLAGGQQYSTAQDIRKLFSLAYRDKVLRNMLVTENDNLTTREGSTRIFKSTNKLLGTYFPILAAKTGYTREAGENLAVMTFGENGQRIGAIVLGSRARFQDTKTLVEWVWRNYNWM